MNIRKNLKLNTNISSQSEEDCKSLGSSGHDLNDHYEQFIIENQVYAEVSTRKCGRNIMEDRFCAIPNYDGQMKQFFYAVYDGHGGTHVAKLLQQRLHQAIRQHQQFKQDLEVAILESSYFALKKSVSLGQLQYFGILELKIKRWRFHCIIGYQL